MCQCAVPENIHTPPTEGIGISWGEGGSLRPNNLKKCMELNWNFQRGGEVLGEIPSVGEVWIFSGTTQYCIFVNFQASHGGPGRWRRVYTGYRQ